MGPAVLRPPSYHLALPPELLSLVLSSSSFVSDSDGTRNATLRAASFVSKDWSTAAYFELSGDLQFEWAERRARRITRSFKANPALGGTVHNLTVAFLTRTIRIDRWYHSLEREKIRQSIRQRWPLDGKWEDDVAEKEDADAFADAHLEASMALSGDRHWLGSSDRSGERIGKDLFWSWASCLSWQALETVLFRATASFDVVDVMEQTVRDQVGRLEYLELVDCSGFLSLSASDLINIRSLVLQTHPILATLAAPSTGTPPLCHLENLDAPPDAPKPPLRNLRSLRLRMDEYSPRRFNYSTYTFSPSLLLALCQTSLTHLTLTTWPSPALISSLLTTLESLDCTLDVEEGIGSDVVRNRLAAVPGWRVRCLPALRSLRIHTWAPKTIGVITELEKEIKDGGMGVLVEEESWRSIRIGLY